MNYIHEIEAGSEDSINVIIEIPKFSRNKYEIDKKTGLIALDRAMHTSQDYPVDYGFVPQTHWHDDDPLDVVVLTSFPLMPGILVPARPIGVLEIIDDGERDDKLICVPKKDPRWDSVLDVSDMNKHTLKEIVHFFSTYKDLQDKKVEVKAVHKKSRAKEIFREARELYKNKMEK